MADALLYIDGNGPDLLKSGGDLKVDTGLETAVVVSLFTDRRALDSDDVPSPGDFRGFWGDAPNDRWGSRLWLLDRAKRTQETLDLGAQYAREALSWLVADGIAATVAASCAWGPSGDLQISVTITRSDTPRWRVLWDAMESRDVYLDGSMLRIMYR